MIYNQNVIKCFKIYIFFERQSKKAGESKVFYLLVHSSNCCNNQHLVFSRGQQGPKLFTHPLVLSQIHVWELDGKYSSQDSNKCSQTKCQHLEQWLDQLCTRWQACHQTAHQQYIKKCINIIRCSKKENVKQVFFFFY